MKAHYQSVLAGCLIAAAAACTASQTNSLQFPSTIEAGTPFSVSTTGSGGAVLYIVGPGQVIRRELHRGETVAFGQGEIHSAGHYAVVLTGSSPAETAELDVTAAQQPSALSFLAKPSRLPVDEHDGISGVAYVFDAFRNLILKPADVSFDLSEAGKPAVAQTAQTHNGVAWVRLDSAPKAGIAQFEARAGNVTEKRIVQQVPGEPCQLRMNAHGAGGRIAVQTDPLLDCRGNAVPDGTIVSFKETFSGGETTVDVPLKRGVAQTTLPAHDGALISVATGVVMGNEIRWQGGR